VIGRGQLELWARGLERFTAERARHDPAQFFDVDYAEFVADPARTVAAYGSRLAMRRASRSRTPIR
jgi:hypothetical protein